MQRKTKLKKLALSAFADDDDDYQTRGDTDISKTTVAEASSNKIDLLDNEQRALITKTASWVANNESKAPMLIEKSRNDKNATLSFLTDSKSASGRFYLKELARLKVEKEVGDVCNNPFGAMVAPINSLLPPVTNAISNSSFNIPVEGSEDQRMKKLVEEQQELQLLESRIREATGMGKTGGNVNGNKLIDQAHESTKLGLQGKLKPETNLSLSSNVQVQEDQANLYVERLKQYTNLAQRVDDGYRDTVEEAEANDGVIAGGTWEHRKRAREMIETASKNLELTVQARGSHHMGDFLPQDVLNNFMKKASAVQTGDMAALQEMAEENNFKKNKLTDSNIGFQLLKNSGWTEGRGLGAKGEGIVNPLSATDNQLNAQSIAASSSAVIVGSSNSGSSSNSSGNGGSSSSGSISSVGVGAAPIDGAGIGVKSTTEVEAADDEFDQYRKRMQLAYKFRPNPMNNPRRNYY